MPTAQVEIDEAGQWYMSGSAQDFYRNHDLVVAHCEASFDTDWSAIELPSVRTTWIARRHAAGSARHASVKRRARSATW